MATGFSNDAGNTSSEYRSYSSWGRTRQPKNINGAHGTRVAAVGAGSVALDLTALNADNTVDRQHRGYATQNQRFLHIGTDGNGEVTNLYAYNYASDRWSELKVGGASVACGTDTSIIVEIAGIDRVAFRGTSSDDHPVFLAGSTF